MKCFTGIQYMEPFIYNFCHKKPETTNLIRLKAPYFKFIRSYSEGTRMKTLSKKDKISQLFEAFKLLINKINVFLKQFIF